MSPLFSRAQGGCFSDLHKSPFQFFLFFCKTGFEKHQYLVMETSEKGAVCATVSH